MTRYQNTINTNISWIPQIPNHWNLMKVNALFQERKCKVSDKVFAPLSVTKKGILPQLEHAAKTNNGDNRKLVKAGDFVINSRSDRKSSCGVSQLDGSVSLINIVLTPREELNGKYIHYLLRNYRFSEEYYRNGRGIVADLWTTRYSEMKSILIPVPPRTEQEQIVRFLDWKVSEINKLIGIERKKLEFLQEMIHSKFQDIILGSKEKISLKRLVFLENEFVKIDSDNFYQKAGMYNRGRGIFLREPVLGKDMGDSKFQRIHKDRLMISGQFAWEDAIYVTTKKDEVGLASHRYYLLKSITSNVPVEYLFGYFFSMKGLSELQRCSHGAAGRNRPLNINELLRIKIPVINDRDLIFSFCKIVRAYMEMRPIVLSKEKLLSELKNRIIADVVTGKIDVRNVEIPEYEHIDDMVDDGDGEENEEELADAEETEA
jgi:type I restriction enzyme S subunit